MRKEYTFFPSLDENSNQQIIFIHGLLGGQGDFLDYINHFRSTSSLILFSLPGHDRNYIKTLNEDLNDWVLNIINFISDKSKDTVFITHSLGSSLINDRIIYENKNIKNIFHIAPLVFSNLFLEKGKELPLTQRVELMIDNNLISPKRIHTHEKINKGNFLKYYNHFSEYLFSINYPFTFNKSPKVKILWGSKDNYIKPASNIIVDKIINGGDHNCHISHFKEVIKFIDENTSGFK
jgi:hypothetical protein